MYTISVEFIGGILMEDQWHTAEVKALKDYTSREDRNNWFNFVETVERTRIFRRVKKIYIDDIIISILCYVNFTEKYDLSILDHTKSVEVIVFQFLLEVDMMQEYYIVKKSVLTN